WRVDEVNEVNVPTDIWKGDVWSFTVIDHFVVEDFESYTSGDNLRNTWPELANAYVYLEEEECHGGSQSMKLRYNNFGTPYYSETCRTFASPQDWTEGGLKALSLWYMGKATNGNEPMYLVLEDTNTPDPNVGIVTYSYPNLLSESWQQWNIDLSDPCFADVNMADIKKIYIGVGDRQATGSGGGVGNVYIDDIELYIPVCLTAYAPDSDFTDDCKVDYEDLDVMSSIWLDYGYTVDANAPNASKLKAWWKFDETSGLIAYDEQGSYNANLDGPTWNSGGHDDGALDFSNSEEDRVWHFLQLPKSAGTITHWLKPTSGGGKAGMVAYYESNGYEPLGAYNGWGGLNILEVHTGTNKVSSGPNGWFFFYQDCFMAQVEGGTVTPGVWTHVAATWDRTGDMVLYANGVEVAREDISDILFTGYDAEYSQCGRTAGKGGRPPGSYKGSWNGLIDEVKVYEYALSQAEVVSVMGESSVHQPVLLPEVDLYTDDLIDFKDFAVLAGEWLDVILWP
ncbi:MAG: LamG domain-containing protein, partial [Desulfobacteraceae bacterium]|nr:LamG domain-containing protein [Desulfobacteraceae bacterium]